MNARICEGCGLYVGAGMEHECGAVQKLPPRARLTLKRPTRRRVLMEAVFDPCVCGKGKDDEAHHPVEIVGQVFTNEKGTFAFIPVRPPPQG